MDLAGDPAQKLKIIHVAGTKGKGSTSAFLAGILQEAGYTVGLYTSPHLHRVNERIRILNTEVGLYTRLIESFQRSYPYLPTIIERSKEAFTRID